MSATATQEASAEVAALTDETRREIVALREAGTTLAELKKRFPQLTSEQIRGVLPPTSKREARARKAKTAEPKTGKQAEVQPEVDPQVAADLAGRLVVARTLPGSSRSVLAQLTGFGPGQIWRIEQGRVRAAEVAKVTEALARLEKDGLPDEYRPRDRTPAVAGPTKAELVHRAEVVAALLGQAREHAKAGTKVRGLVDDALSVIESGTQPAEEPKQTCAVCGTSWAASATPPAHSTPGGEGPAGQTHDFVAQS